MVSKPIAPPWTDSGKNLVRDVARFGDRFTYRLLTTPEHAARQRPGGFDRQADAPRIDWDPIYRAPGRYAPALSQNLRVLRRLLRGDDAAIRHYFFAPNPRTSMAARLVSRVRPARTVQSVLSSPRDGEDLARLLFADRIVVLSDYNRRRVEAAGVDPRRVALIPPGVEIPPLPSAEERARTRARHGLGGGPAVLFAGDYEFSRGARVLAAAIPRVLERTPATFVYACRIKRAASRAGEAAVRAELAASGAAAHVRFLNEVGDILDLVAACDVCVLPSESLYAKMDLPLVLLEALARAVPIVVADVEPLREALVGDAGLAVPPLQPDALADALAALLCDPARRRRMGEAARRAAESRFDARDVARRHEDLYDSMLVN